jgi:hypothetical protein
MIPSDYSYIENAYTLWSKKYQNQDPESSVAKITNQLFKHSYKNYWLCQIFPSLSRIFIRINVLKALSAYKFDILEQGLSAKNLHLFSKKEKWFFEKNLTGMLRNILIKPTAKDRKKLKMQIIDKNILEKKARRWDEKINKYFNKEYFMVANTLIYLSTFRFPKLTGIINKYKTIGKSKIELEANSLGKLDPDVYEGLKKFLGDQNLNPKNPKFLNYVGKIIEAKTERISNNIFSSIRNNVICRKSYQGLGLLSAVASKLFSLFRWA